MNWGIILYLVAQSVSAVASGKAEPRINTLKTYTRIIIPSQSISTFRVKRDSNSAKNVVLTIENPRVDESKVSSYTLSDTRVEKVQFSIKENQPLQTNLQLKYSDSEVFAYFQPVPPAVIVDIWRKQPAVVKKKSNRNKINRKVSSLKKSVPKTNSDKISSPLKRVKNIFADFEPPKLGFSYRGEGFDTTKEVEPDSRWTWTIPNNDEPEAVNIKLAIKLFHQALYGLVLKTIDITNKEFPDSKYKDELAFLKAVTFRRIGKQKHDATFEKRSMTLLEELKVLTDKNGKSPKFLPNVRLFFASDFFRKQKWFLAIEELEYIINAENFKKQEDYPWFLLATSIAYIHIKDYSRAERLLNYVYSHYKSKKVGKQAGYRLANLLFIEKKYSRAEELFLEMIEKNKNEASPEVYWSLAEIYFHTAQDKKSQDRFREFINRYPSHPLASIANVRLGELEEIRNGSLKKARYYYTKSINRFPFGIAVNIAKIRLARLRIDEEFDPEYQLKILSDILNDIKNPAKVRSMARATFAQYLLKNGMIDEAIDQAQKGIASSISHGLPLFKKIYMSAILEKAKKLHENKQNTELLAHYSKYKKWLEEYPETYLMLSTTFRELGLYKTSNYYLTQYSNNNSNGRKIASEQNKNLKLAINLYLQGDCRKALDTLAGEDRNLTIMAIQAICKNNIGEKKDAFKLAEITLKRIKNSKEMNRDDKEMFIVDLTEVKFDYFISRKEYDKAEDLLSTTNKILKSSNQRFLYLEADMYWYQKKYVKAIQAYNQALKQYPQNVRKDRAQFNLAMAYVAIGQKDAAVNVLTELSKNSQNIWSSSASHELELLRWEENYSNILSRLPPDGLGL